MPAIPAILVDPEVESIPGLLNWVWAEHLEKYFGETQFHLNLTPTQKDISFCTGKKRGGGQGAVASS
jgi:hypothetical protein